MEVKDVRTKAARDNVGVQQSAHVVAEARNAAFVGVEFCSVNTPDTYGLDTQKLSFNNRYLVPSRLAQIAQFFNPGNMGEMHVALRPLKGDDWQEEDPEAAAWLRQFTQEGFFKYADGRCDRR